MSSKTLEQYLVAAIERGQVDHALRAFRAPSGKVTFYVRPLNGDGETLDFVVRDNAMVLNLTNDSDVPDTVLEAAQNARAPKQPSPVILMHPSHPDVPRPSDADLVALAHCVCRAIEACGASPELTKAVVLAGDLACYLQKPASAPEPIVQTSIGGMPGEPNPVHLAVDLGHAIAKLAQSISALETAERGAVNGLIKSMAAKSGELLGD